MGPQTPDDPTDDTGSWEKVPDEEGGTLIDFVVDETTGVEFVDVDGDGDDDIVVTTEDGKPSVVYLTRHGERVHSRPANCYGLRKAGAGRITYPTCANCGNDMERAR